MKTLFLTGSSGSLGRVIRSYYLEHGWNVAGFDAIDDNFKANSFNFYNIDSTSELSVNAAFTDAARKFSVPDQLIATIGGLKPWAYADEQSLDDFKFVIDLNITSTFVCTKEALKLMKPQLAGSVVTFGAETALHPDPKKTAYVAAKSAVIGFTQTVSLETREYGVTANCVVPTVIHTKANEEWGAPEDIKKWTEPDDIAALCFYLASDPGKAMNGAVLRIPNKM
jgi:3-oxoacyl-[acyl-carrier protein] reductase